MRCLSAFIAISTGVTALAAPTEIPTVLLSAARLSDWEFVATPSVPIESAIGAGAEGALAVAGKPIGYLQTRASHRNYQLHLEWRWTGAPGNAGVLLHIDSGPIDRRIWPRCLQVQTKHTRAGDLLPMAGARFTEPLTPGMKSPQRNRSAASSEKPPGQWNTCDVVCRAGVVEVRINDVAQNRVTGCAPAAGRIGLQLEGAPYELRAVTLLDFDEASAPAPAAH